MTTRLVGSDMSWMTVTCLNCSTGDVYSIQRPSNERRFIETYPVDVHSLYRPGDRVIIHNNTMVRKIFFVVVAVTKKRKINDIQKKINLQYISFNHLYIPYEKKSTVMILTKLKNDKTIRIISRLFSIPTHHQKKKMKDLTVTIVQKKIRMIQ
ncbi:hypothetical protein BDA99DRAFT_521546 [Phascolomyces articulosus]|uniref:Uncharacterized protein n=1 Tax=Phascolomyces articulosus TaxID=60185 RepID=A0AAD5K373_9FUNG|nr:hypothetical protein BDA99DRAFT_521546 [Phascolomyces articulosus]